MRSSWLGREGGGRGTAKDETITMSTCMAHTVSEICIIYMWLWARAEPPLFTKFLDPAL